MSQSRSEDEVLVQRQSSMGAQLGELHFLLWKEFAWLQVSWSEYRTLYSNPETLVNLNAAAPRFFYWLDYLMWHDVLLHICRLTDAPTTAGKSNLSIAQLPNAISHPELKTKVDKLVSLAQSKAQFARDWRNRHLAHRDLEKSKNPAAKPLAAASRASVEEVLKAIAAALNAVQEHFEDSATAYHDSVVSPGGAVSLLRVLERGLFAPRMD